MIDDYNFFALIKDKRVAEKTMESLKNIRGYCEIRDEKKRPCKPKTLHSEQLYAAKHIIQQPITLVEGGPGTGKTELIVWLLYYFQKVLIVSYVGMMVNSLTERLNGHSEAVRTIHYVISAFKYVEGAKEWLNTFEVLVIDEFSNVDIGLFQKLLACFPNLKKLVLFGDLGQIHPIKPGCPLHDMSYFFGRRHHTFKLKENHRVEEHSRNLANLSKSIYTNGTTPDSYNKFKYPFRKDVENYPLVLLEVYPKQYARQFNKIIQTVKRKDKKFTIMDIQFVVLTNLKEHGRKNVNSIVENIFFKGMRTKHKLRNDVYLFKGKKITFLKNYGMKEVKLGTGTVMNGELCIIHDIKKDKNDGITLTVSDSVYENVGKSKKVYIHKENGIDPLHVDSGYACTSNKAQGSEWKYIVFCMIPDPSNFWTREYPYVAVSRAKRCCFVVGFEKDFHTMCMYKTTKRATIFNMLLGQNINQVVLPSIDKTSSQITLFNNFDYIQLYSSRENCCVPTLHNYKKRKKRRKEKNE